MATWIGSYRSSFKEQDVDSPSVLPYMPFCFNISVVKIISSAINFGGLRYHCADHVTNYRD